MERDSQRSQRAFAGAVWLVSVSLTASGCMQAASVDADAAGGPERDAGGTCTRPPCGDDDAAEVEGCVPDCSPGYVCLDATCVEACNPACSDDEICTADRICEPRESVDAGLDVAPADDVIAVADTRLDAATEVGGSEQDAGACIEAVATPRNVRDPVDLVIAVDTSGSMDQESDGVAARLNELAAELAAAGSNLRVVLVADNGVCIPPPLSGAIGCPDVDSTTFHHARSSVDSSEVFSTILASWSTFATFLRPTEAALHFLAVTDDNDDQTWRSFETQIDTLDGRSFTFHSLTAANISGGDTGLVPCVGWQGVGAAPGAEYRALSDRTGGVKASICEDDWDGIFAALGEAIAERSVVPCEYALPDPGGGMEVDTNRVNVRVHPPGEPDRVVANLDSLEDCGADGGWVWANIERTRIELCASVCGENVDSVSLEFGCETIKG